MTLTASGQGVSSLTGAWVRARLDMFLLGAVLVVAAALRLWELDDDGQNLFYAAGVRSMLDSWHNFFFLSFDPGGSLAIDKPPLGLWVEAGSARVFGFHYWALALPQALAGVTATWVLFAFVRGLAGRWTAALAALFMAIAPASVVTARNNTFDTLTMLLSLLAAWSLSASVRSGQVRWLLVSAALLGLAFNAKMAEAFLPLPAFGTFWLLRHQLDLKRALVHAGLFAAVLTVVSLSWVTAVGVTPAADRPVVYNGEGNSIWALTFRYNGIDRVLGRQSQERVRGETGAEMVSLLRASVPPHRGPLRLVTSRLANEVGWFLPLAGAGLVVVVRRRFREPADILWSVWLVSGAVYFSMAQVVLPQYLEAIAPPLAVLAAIGVVEARRLVVARPILGVTLCVAAAAYWAWLLARNPGEQRLALAVLALALLAVSAASMRGRAQPSRTAVTAGLLALVIAGPLSWSLVTVGQPARGSATRYPLSGPPAVRSSPEAAGGDQPSSAHPDPALRFVEGNTAGMRYLTLTERALFGNSARYVIQANRPVLTLDTFGGDEAWSVQSIAALVASGELRYAELPPGGPWEDARQPLGAWFTAHCQDLTPRGIVPLGGEGRLYECSP